MNAVNLIVLYPEDDGPVAEVVYLLREALRRAEAGEITGVALAMACHPRAEMNAIATGRGGVAALRYKIGGWTLPLSGSRPGDIQAVKIVEPAPMSFSVTLPDGTRIDVNMPAR